MDLKDIRKRLDDVDSRLLDALSEREQLVSAVAQVKIEGSDRFRDRAREEEILSSLVERGKHVGLDGYYVTRLFREIIEHSIRLQQEALADNANPDRARAKAWRVGYQGRAGSYSSMAAERHFSASKRELEIVGYDSFELVLEAVRDGHVDYAMLPIENTTAGSINDAYDLLARMDLALVGEEIQPVEHCLIGLPEASLSDIRRVYSHPQALLQCTRFLGALTDCRVESYIDTAMSVEKVKAECDLSQAAVASERAAAIHGLKILERGIANQPENFTRFVVVAARPFHFDARIPCKTSIVFATRHEHGALLRCLTVLDRHDLNCTKLESRPRTNTPWEYLFYLDFQGNIADPNVDSAIRELAEATSFLKVLGSYPARNTKDMAPASPRPLALDAGPRLQPSADPSESSFIDAAMSAAAAGQTRSVRVGAATFGAGGCAVVARLTGAIARDQAFSRVRKLRELGVTALSWNPAHDTEGRWDPLDGLVEAAAAFDLPLSVEVHEPADVATVSARVAMVELPPEGMHNAELLAEVGRMDRPVLLRRGHMASIDSWLQAADHIVQRGNRRVVLCERGIRTFETATPYTLDLGIVPVVGDRSGLVVAVEPGPSAGSRAHEHRLGFAAMAVGADAVWIDAGIEAGSVDAGLIELIARSHGVNR